MTPTKRRVKSQNSSVLEFRTPNRKNMNRSVVKTPNRRRTRKGSNVRQSKSQIQAKYKRSIVVLNEHDEFEDIEVYIAKRRTQIKKKTKV